MKKRLLKIFINIALLVFPTLFSMMVFSTSWQSNSDLYSGIIAWLSVGGYFFTIVLIVVAYKFKMCNLWVFAVGFLLSLAYVPAPETGYGGGMINLFPNLGHYLFSIIYKIFGFIAALTLAIIRTAQNKEVQAIQAQKRDDIAPEDDPQRR